MRGVAHIAWRAAWRVVAMTPIERAKADLSKMTTEISRLQMHLAMLQQRREKVSAYVEMAEFYETEDSVAETARPRGGTSGAAVRAAVEAIRTRRVAIHTRELLEMLTKQGLHIGGTNPVANLSGFLSRSDELRNSRANGWGLAEWGAPPDEQTEAATADNEAVADQGAEINETGAIRMPSWLTDNS